MSLGPMWKLRNPRERGLILLASAVALMAGGYEWVVAPVIKGRAELAERLPALRSQSVDLVGRLEATRQAAKTQAEGKQALSEVSLRESLALAQLQARAVKVTADTAEISFAEGELGAMLRWAAQAPAVFGVSIKHLSVTWKEGKPDVLIRLAL